MALPHIETVQMAIKPLEPMITRAYMRAWKDWRDAGLMHWRKRGRANFVWEQAAHYVAVDLADVPGVTIIVRHESYHFLVNDVVSFRLKKADQSGFTSNYPTQEAMAFHDPQLPLEGVPVEQRVEVVYSLDSLETDISDILVVARDGETIAWSYSLLGDEAVTALPIKASIDGSDDQAERTGLVRAKGRDAQQDTTGEAGGT